MARQNRSNEFILKRIRRSVDARNSGGDSIKLARWALPCYVMMLLTLVYLAARADMVQRWQEETRYVASASDRYSQLDYLLRSMEAKNLAFFEYALGQYLSIEAMNCLAKRLTTNLPKNKCPSGSDADWRMLSPTSATGTQYTYAQDHFRLVRTIAPVMQKYVTSEGVQRERARAQLEVHKSNHVDPVDVADKIALLMADPERRRKVAIWALYDNPPGEFVSYRVSTGAANTAGMPFGDIQPEKRRVDLRPVKEELLALILNHYRDENFLSRVTEAREQWLKRVSQGEVFKSDSRYALALGGVPTNLRELGLVIPILIVGLYAIYCARYVTWLGSNKKIGDMSDFPALGYGFSAVSLIGDRQINPKFGWAVAVSLPIGVLSSLIAVVSWPLVYGDGIYFYEELCRTYPNSGAISCAPLALIPITALVAATSLTILVVQAEVKQLAISHENPKSFSAIFLSSLGVGAIIASRAILGTDTNVDAMFGYVITSSANYWMPFVCALALIAGCGRKGAIFSLACSLAIFAFLPPTVSELLEQPKIYLPDSCHGPACHIQ
jgi:hypothetical protein